VPFHQQLTKNFPDQFEVCCLTRLYRSSSPMLRQVFEKGRATVLGTEPAPQRLERLRQVAHAACAPVPSVDDRPSLADDELVLFRRRSEVLLASSFLASKHVPHRIRMGQTSLGTHAWLTCLFGTEPANVVDRRDLDRRWDLAAGLPHLRGLDRDHTWKLLGRLAGTTDGNAVDVRTLRRLVARARPPAELCQTEVGVAGPIIGTIHGSKGREANTVSLMLSKVHEAAPALALDEEVRVTYVGSTRARQELLVGKGYVGFGFKALGKSGRVYRPRSVKGKDPGRIQVELGRPGDVDELAVVSRARWTATEVQRAQSFLTGYAGAVVSLIAP
jgi:hypothetical protein